jgi:signal transduction histidine kinase
MGGTDPAHPAEERRRAARSPSVSRQLQYLAVAVLAIIIGAAAQQLIQGRASLLADTERQMARLDMVFAEQTGRTVETVDLLLRDICDVVQSRRGAPPDEAALSALLRRRVDGVRQITAMGITDAAGSTIATSSANSDTTEPDGLRELLRRYASVPERSLQFTEPFRERDGSWGALILRAIPAPGESTDGLVYAHLNLRYFEDFYKAVELTENGAILLHRRDGTVLARYPHNETIVGTSYAALPPFRDILSRASAGTLRMPSPIDGQVRVMAIRALKAFPLAVNVSVDEAMIMAPWRQQVVLLGGVALVASAIVATLLLLLAQRSRQVEVLVGEFRAARDSAEQANANLLEQMQERERAEAALRQAQRLEVVGQLTGGVAHDFNNLLTVILGSIELMTRTAKLEGTQGALLGTIRSAAERGAALTAQLLAFARRQPLQPMPLDVGAILGGMKDLLASALGTRVRVVQRIAPDLWPAMMDPTQIELLVLNLGINARDAMEDHGTLTIAASNATRGAPERPEQPPAGEYVRIVVSDTGTGMSPDVLAKVFEPFFTTKLLGKGSGLGLSQVLGVARQSGGGVQIETALGVGTAVSVFLPRSAIAPALAALPPGAPLVARNGDVVVLMVDDDDAVRATTTQLLRHLGYSVTEADSGPSAIALLRGGLSPDVVLSDVAMPGMSGPELARHIRAGWAALPMVFFSGYADPEAVAGADPLKRLVRKPFRPAELAAQLEAAIAERAGVGAAT